jgi:hypothetical protein
MATIYDWSTTAATNSSAGTPINWAESQLPNTVNNSSREMMKQIADWRNLLGGAKITATADTMTLTSGLSLAAYAQGNLFAFECGAANTTAVTINVDSLGAKAIVKNYNVALVAGDLVAGGIYVIAYEATAGNFQLISPVSTVPVTLAAAQTLTNKTLTSPVLNGTLSGTAFLDEDDMSSSSAIAAASQQSIKAYADGRYTAAVAATAADVIATAADAVQTALDRIATAADASSTAADVLATNADAVSTAANAVSTAADAATALAAAQGWGAVTTLTTGTTNVEVANARTYYILDATGGTITVNMPAIGTSDGILFGFEVSNVDNAITIVRDGTDTINGVAGNYSGLISVGQVIHFIGDDTSPDNWLATIVSQVGAASDTAAGIIELSTDAEALTGTATNRALTPANVASLGYATKTRTTRANTGTTDTLVIGDAGNIVTSSNASAQTVTIPPNSSVAFPVGTQIDIINKGAGVTSVAGGTGVTVNGVSTGTGAIDAQYKAVTIIKDATDTWFMVGAHGTVA